MAPQSTRKAGITTGTTAAAKAKAVAKAKSKATSKAKSKEAPPTKRKAAAAGGSRFKKNKSATTTTTTTPVRHLLSLSLCVSLLLSFLISPSPLSLSLFSSLADVIINQSCFFTYYIDHDRGVQQPHVIANGGGSEETLRRNK